MSKKYIKTTLMYIILTLIALFLVGPFLWLLFTSIKTTGNVYKLTSISDIFPTFKDVWPLTNIFENFKTVLKTVPLILPKFKPEFSPGFFLNTIWITFWGISLELLICSLAAYPLARLNFPGKNFFFFLFISTLMLPAQANMIINFVTIRKLGLFDTYTAVILPSIVNIFGIFLMRQAYIVIPQEVEDAARIDGCSELNIWYRIMLPLARPALATLAIFSFLAHWNSFMWPLIILKSETKYPFSVGLSYLSNMFASDFRSVAAGAVLSMIPVIVIFILMQKQFIRGITTGAVK